MNKGFTLFELFFVLVIWVLGAGGWILNLIQVVMHIKDPLTAYIVLKIIAIFAFPLGCVLGWVGLFF